MSLDDRKALARRCLGLWASDSTDKAEDLVAPGYLNHQEPDVAGGVTAKNLDEWRELVSGFHESFSDSTVEILIQVGEGDLVATRWAFTATHTGAFMGYPATGKRVTWFGTEVDRFENGKIVESWVDWDKFSFLNKLGLVPQP